MGMKDFTFPEEFENISFFSSVIPSMFDSFETDSSGNYHLLTGKGSRKIQIIFRISPSGTLVGGRLEEGYKATAFGNEKFLNDAMLYDSTSLVGILRSNKENQYQFKPFDKNIDYTGKVLLKNSKTICKGKKLYGENVDSLISYYLAKNIVDYNFDSDKQIDFTIWNASLSGESGLVSAIRYTKPDQIIFLSLVTSKECAQENDPTFVLKDGNYVLPQDQKANLISWTKQEDIFFGGFVGKLDKFMEIIDIHSVDSQLLGVYLPTQGYDTAVREVFCSVVEKTLNILLKYIASL